MKFKKFNKNTESWLKVKNENSYVHIRASDIEGVEIIPSNRFIVRATMISGRAYIIAKCQTVELAQDVVDKTLKVISGSKELVYVDLEDTNG